MGGGREWEWWKPWKKWGFRFGKIGYDDWTIVVALIFLAGYTTLNILGATHGGMGKHVYDVSLNSIRYLMKLNFAHTIVYLTLSFFIKLSILLFYLNLFPTSFNKMRWAIYCLIAFFFVYTIIGICIISFVCKPVQAFWKLELRGFDNCPSQEELERRYNSVLAIHVAGDFVVLSLPIKLVMGLRLPKRQKAILVCLFGAGGLACIASILRLIYFPRINSSLDVTWNVTEIALWGQVEACTAVICASIPSLKPLFSSLNRKRKHHDSTSRSEAAISGASTGYPAMSGHSRNGSNVSAISFNPSKEKRVSFTPSEGASRKVSTAGVGSSASTLRRSRDPYEPTLEEIDNMKIFLDDEAEGKATATQSVTAPERAHVGNSRQHNLRRGIFPSYNLREYDDQDVSSVTSTTTSTTKTSYCSTPLDWGSPTSTRKMSIPQENYLQLPPAQRQRPQIYPLRTESTPPTSETKNTHPPSPRSSSPETIRAASPDASQSSIIPAPNNTKPLPSLPCEKYVYTRYSPGKEDGTGATSPPRPYYSPYSSVSYEPCTSESQWELGGSARGVLASHSPRR
ncbi:hypothetical protein BDZ91DRAFT_552224 [Kalaharituber pfeilii]|nr:hypothetical protein BDZ91DRAFT_552224 [Kalaharituber pfeilii]